MKHIVTTAYHAQANGIIERGHQAFTKAMAILVTETGKGWPTHFYNILWADRVTVRRTIGLSAFYMLYGKMPVLPVHFQIPVFRCLDRQITETEGDAVTAKLICARAAALNVLNGDREMATRYIKAAKQYNKEYFDATKTIRAVPLKVGDYVLVHNS